MTLTGQHAVKFIKDDQLPPEQDWALLECDGEIYFAIKESRVTERTLEDGWAAYRQRVADVAPTRRLRAV